MPYAGAASLAELFRFVTASRPLSCDMRSEHQLCSVSAGIDSVCLTGGFASIWRGSIDFFHNHGRAVSQHLRDGGGDLVGVVAHGEDGIRAGFLRRA